MKSSKYLEDMMGLSELVDKVKQLTVAYALAGKESDEGVDALRKAFLYEGSHDYCATVAALAVTILAQFELAAEMRSKGKGQVVDGQAKDNGQVQDSNAESRMPEVRF